MNILVDENMPRSLAPRLAGMGHSAQDVRDIGLRGHDDREVFARALADDALIITRDRGFSAPRGWPPGFTAGVVFVNFSEGTPASVITDRVVDMFTRRLPASLLGTLTVLEPRRALSRVVRRR